jgi:predicted nucleic acid-binding protein
MRTYFDTSFLLPVYVREKETIPAVTIFQQQNTPGPFSHLLEIELRTAIRVKKGRGQITGAEMKASLQALESDLAKGILLRPKYDLETVFTKAEELSAKHAAATLTRTADLWHIAAALECHCRAFASFDERQRKAATLCGLEVLPQETVL